MKFITPEAIDGLNDMYYTDRWPYFKDVIDEIKLMDGINTTLELGPYKTPLIEGGDVIDITDIFTKDYPINVGNFYKHDCSITPYPIEDKRYDLVIACQVLEHLGRNQKEVFKEFSRISKKAIITLPYKYFAPCDVHHMIDERVIDTWAQGLKPVYEKIVPSNRISRIIRIYNFDDSVIDVKHSKQLQEHVDFKVLSKLEEERSKLKAERNKRIELEEELKEKNRLLSEVLNSTSWRYTKPLRELKLMFKSKDH